MYCWIWAISIAKWKGSCAGILAGHSVPVRAGEREPRNGVSETRERTLQLLKAHSSVRSQVWQIFEAPGRRRGRLRKSRSPTCTMAVLAYSAVTVLVFVFASFSAVLGEAGNSFLVSTDQTCYCRKILCVERSRSYSPWEKPLPQEGLESTVRASTTAGVPALKARGRSFPVKAGNGMFHYPADRRIVCLSRAMAAICS